MASNIAITGLSCRFPGDGSDLKGFWDSLCSGKSSWSSIPKTRFDRRAFGDKIPQGAHFLTQDIAAFDAPFFSITAAEARAMDPQQRMTLEVVYEALESAGYPLHTLSGTKTGVFMGQLTSDYQELVCRDMDFVMDSKFSLTGLQRTSLANRVSWLFDLRGPSFTLDTACSSSLTALHLACESLISGECDTAIVGGCNIIINPDMFVCLGGQGFLAPDGKCKAFDASGDGYGRGEGLAAVVLRRVDDAVANGDAVRAVVRGTGNNQDGHTVGFTLPSAEAQAALIRGVYGKAGLDFSRTGYVEAHGTGTKAGDLEETTAISNTLSTGCGPNKELIIGSVKTNIGHLEAGAGVAGVIKSVLMLESAMIPPNVHFHHPNPAIKFDEWKLKVPTELMPWPSEPGNGTPLRRISINSFGYGGSNSHVIMDDAQSFLSQRRLGNALNGHRPTAPGGPYLLTLSAQDKEGVDRVKKALGAFLRSKNNTSTGGSEDTADEHGFLQSLAYTLNERRSPLQWKTYAVASSLEDLVDTLDPPPGAHKDAPAPAPQFLSSRAPKLGFVFTGQGAQWATMGMDLMTRFPVFSASVQAADTFLATDLASGWSATEELSRGKSTSKLNKAEFSQALCTVLQVALVDLLRDWGITPHAVVGHSSGEIAAAYCWGVLSREDAWRVAYYRGLLSSRLREESGLEGAMMAVGASEDEVEEAISNLQASLLEEDGEVHVACVNSPQSITVSGDVGAIDKLQVLLHENGLFARKLQVDTAYHSPHMEMMAAEYFEAIAGIANNAPKDPGMKMYSSVSGDMIDASELGPAYWIRNAVSPVQFCAAVQNLVRGGSGEGDASVPIDILVEVGPHSALLGPATQSLKAVGITNKPYYSVLTRFQNATNTALNLAGTLSARGHPVHFQNINRATEGSSPPSVIINLPSYPWNHSQKLWSESRIGRAYRLRDPPTSALLGPAYPSVVAGEHVWRGFVRLADKAWAGWLPDHRISGSVVCPGAGFIAMAIEAARALAASEGAAGQGGFGKRPSAVRLRDVNLISALVVDAEEDVEYMVSLRPFTSSVRETTAAWSEFTITSCRDGKALEKNCAGLIMLEFDSSRDDDDAAIAKEAHRVAAEVCTTVVKPEDLYESLSAAGLQLGPTFQNLAAVNIGMRHSSSTVVIPDVGLTNLAEAASRPHLIHPVVLDTIFQSAFPALITENKTALSTAMVPKVIDEIFISASIPYKAASKLTGFADAARYGFKEIMADITMFSEDQPGPVVQISGFCCSEVAGAAAGGGADGGSKSGRSLLSKIVRRPALEFMSGEELRGFLTQDTRQDNLAGTSPDSTLDSLCKFINLVHHTNPSLSILEIAPATADQSFTASSSLLLNTLPHISEALLTGTARIWCKTQESKDSLTHEAETKLAGKAIDPPSIEIQEFPPSEKFEPSPVDILLLPFTHCSSVPEIVETVQTASKLLSPTGRLCLVLPCDGTAQAEIEACLGDCITLDGPEGSQPGGKPVRLLIGSPKEALSNGIHALTNGEDKSNNVTILLPSAPSTASKSLAAAIAQALSARGKAPSTVLWHDFGSPSDNDILQPDMAVISLLELDQPAVAALQNATAFTQLQKLVLTAKSLLWVAGMEDGDPSKAMVSGLARCVRNEEPGLGALQTLHVHGLENTAAAAAKADEVAGSIVKVFEYGQTHSDSQDHEFFHEANLIHTDRIIEDTPLNTTLHHMLHPSTTTKTTTHLPLSQAGAIALTVQNAGLLDTLTFTPDPLATNPLSPDDVEITVRASSLNFRDVMTTMGNLPGTLLGFDCAGVVRRVGAAAAKFKVGDRVAMMQPGSHRTVHRAKVECVQHIPEDMTFEEAATIPVVHGTAWYALVKLGQARRGQSVLIHAAAGGVGQAAIMIANHIGLEVFATVGSAEKRRLITEKYGVPDDHIFNSRDYTFAAGIKGMTHGRGVDIILNSLSGEALRQTWYCIAPFGTFVEIGIKDILGNSRLDMKPFTSSATFTFFDINRIIRDRRDITADIMHGVFEMQRAGITKPVGPLAVYPVADVEKAFRLMQTGKHLGKIVLSFADNQQIVPVLAHHELPARLQSLSLDPEAVYILAGGLGGLGRSLSRLLVDEGARKICFLSRSGATAPAARDVVHELQSRSGVKVLALPCDIADEAALQTAVQAAKQQLGAARVGGLIQCAMVLRDTLFRNMTHADWIDSTHPKVQGTSNLHRVLASEPDFFVVLSSFAAIFGNRGQANYAAAGAYQDAIAHARRAQGLSAVTIDVGLMRDVGVLAETGMVAGLADWEEPYGIRESELMNIVKLAIAGDVPPQILTGLATGGSAAVAGIEKPWYLDSDAKFAILAQAGMKEARAATAAGEAGTSSGNSVPALLSAASSKEEATAIITTALVARVAKTLQTTASEIDSERFLHSYGIDSLTAIELVNWAMKECKSHITVFDVMAAMPISATAKKIADKSKLVAQGPAA